MLHMLWLFTSLACGRNSHWSNNIIENDKILWVALIESFVIACILGPIYHHISLQKVCYMSHASRCFLVTSLGLLRPVTPNISKVGHFCLEKLFSIFQNKISTTNFCIYIINFCILCCCVCKVYDVHCKVYGVCESLLLIICHFIVHVQNLWCHGFAKVNGIVACAKIYGDHVLDI